MWHLKVSELIDILLEQDLDAEVILRGDFEYPIFARVKAVYPGAFKDTAYGNDFLDYEVVLLPDEVRAVLIEAQEEVDLEKPIPIFDNENH